MVTWIIYELFRLVDGHHQIMQLTFFIECVIFPDGVLIK
jgi:hypothetical protein